MTQRSLITAKVEPGAASEATDSQDEAPPEQQAGPGPSTSRARTTQLKTLGKGRACVKCRSRKMVRTSSAPAVQELTRPELQKCDGKHPTCSPCQRQNRECIYEPERTRTQKLLDKIELLEGRLAELRVSRSDALGAHGEAFRDRRVTTLD